MRRFAFLLVLAALLLRPSVAAADSIVLADWTSGDFANNAAGGGGPFQASTTGTLLGDIDFITMCIEFNEHFSYGTPYTFTLSDSATNGGVGGGNPDPLSDATKWLYYQAVTGGYTSFYAIATGLAPNANVGASFQYAVWYLEQEQTAAQIGGVTSSGYLLANYALANQNWGSLSAAGNRVFAMNLTDVNGSPVQDQLAYRFESTVTQQAVPEPGSLLLVGSGLIAVYRRRSRKASTS